MRPDCCPKRIRRQMARPSHVEVYRESSGLSRKLCYSLMRSSNRGTMGITLQPSRQKLIIVQVMSEPVDPFWMESGDSGGRHRRSIFTFVN